MLLSLSLVKQTHWSCQSRRTSWPVVSEPASRLLTSWRRVGCLEESASSPLTSKCASEWGWIVSQLVGWLEATKRHAQSTECSSSYHMRGQLAGNWLSRVTRNHSFFIPLFWFWHPFTQPTKLHSFMKTRADKWETSSQSARFEDLKLMI